MPNYVSKLSVDNVLALVRDTAAQTLCANLRNDLTAETNARESADTALSGRLDAETNARERADTALSGRIDAETNARESADTALSGRIDAETSARKSADNALEKRITETSKIITPEMFGAKGDGTTDDTTAMQNAINESSTNGKILLIPAKTYKCTELIGKDNMHIEGVAGYNSVILLTTDGFHGLESNNYYVDGVTIKNIRLKNGGSNLTGFKFLLLRGVIENCYADRFFTGFHMVEVTDAGWYQNNVDNGELHGLINCDAIQCDLGFNLKTWDSIYVNLVSSRCNRGIECGSCSLQGAHIWGFGSNGLIVTNGSRLSNIEVEGAINNEVTPVGILAPNVIINGLYIWNINIDKNLIWCNNADYLQIRGLLVGDAGTLLPDVDATKISIIGGSAKAAYIDGSIDESYTSGDGNKITTPCVVNIWSSHPEVARTIQANWNSRMIPTAWTE